MTDTRPAILITGAARGIGRAIVNELATDHRIAITYLTAQDEADDLSAQGITCIQADFNDLAAPAKVIRAATMALGPLSGLVNNAGEIALTPIENFDHTLADRVMRVNALAPIALISAALSHFTPDASIVNITSINAKTPAAPAIAYSASKAALENATVAMAKALGPKGIRVNAVAPGAVERDHSPRSEDLKQLFLNETALARLPEDREIAAATRFLLSSAASGMTGTILPVSTGFRL